jgi:hypothetical protein
VEYFKTFRGSVSGRSKVAVSSLHHRVHTILGPIQCVPGIKRLRRKADHSPPFSAKVKNAWSYNSTPPISLHGMVLS